MAYKDPEQERLYKQQWYRCNKELVKTRSRKTTPLYRQRNLDFVRNLKEKTPCADCKNFYPHYVMDFDHITGNKVDSIGNMANNGFSLDNIKEEIAKCEIVCSNCHRKRTWERGGN